MQVTQYYGNVILQCLSSQASVKNKYTEGISLTHYVAVEFIIPAM